LTPVPTGRTLLADRKADPVLPSSPVAPNAGSPAPTGRRGRIRALVLMTVALAVLAFVADGAASFVFVLAVTALGTAGLLILHARSAAAAPRQEAAVAMRPATASAADVDPLAQIDLTERLRRLYDEHVEQLNMAVAEDRLDLVQELSDGYMDQALRLITAGASPEWLSVH
jgi:hypothetical protein